MTDQTPHIRPDMQGFLDMIGGSERADDGGRLTLEEARASYQAMHNIADRPARALPVIRDLGPAPAPAGDIPLRLYDARETRGRGPRRWWCSTTAAAFVIGAGSRHPPCTVHRDRGADRPARWSRSTMPARRGRPSPAAILDCEAASRWVAGSPRRIGPRSDRPCHQSGDQSGRGAKMPTGCRGRAQNARCKPRCRARWCCRCTDLFPLVADGEKPGSGQPWAGPFSEGLPAYPPTTIGLFFPDWAIRPARPQRFAPAGAFPGFLFGGRTQRGLRAPPPPMRRPTRLPRSDPRFGPRI